MQVANVSRENTKAANTIFWAVLSAVSLIAVGSFFLSFSALHGFANDNGAPPKLSWIWPLIIDLSMVIYTVTILVSQLQRWSAKYPIALTITYSVVTVIGNIWHAPPTLAGWFVAIWPPLSLIFGAEMLRIMARQIIERKAAVMTLEQLTTQIDSRNIALDRLDSELNRKTTELDSLRNELEEVQNRLDQVTSVKPISDIGTALQIIDVTPLEQRGDTKQLTVQDRRQMVLDLASQGMTPPDIAEQLAVSVRTVYRDLDNRQNGNGKGTH